MVAEMRKRICQCRSCNNVFNQEDANRVERSCLGMKVIDRVCPNCGSKNHGAIEYIAKHSIEGVYLTDKYFKR